MPTCFSHCWMETAKLASMKSYSLLYYNPKALQGENIKNLFKIPVVPLKYKGNCGLTVFVVVYKQEIVAAFILLRNPGIQRQNGDYFMSKQKILALLQKSDESYTSGESMSRELGISRAAVSKAVNSLRQEGYEIDSVTNRGYRLLSGPDRLTRGEILPWLHVNHVGSTLECYDTIDSTNNYLKREALHLPDGTVAVANEQTSGRGRLGRSFQSPADTGIYLSALVRPNIPPAEALNFTAFVAVAICEGIEAATGLRPEIKWTNDIVLNKKKVCGILTEMSIEGESGALQYIITGIGINVNQQEQDFPEDIRDIAGSLAMAAGGPVRRGRLAAEVINALDQMYTAWLNGGGDYLERYRARCLTVGRPVKLLRANGTQEPAEAIAVADDFGLVVRHPDGREEKVTSGEVSVRGLWGYVD